VKDRLDARRVRSVQRLRRGVGGERRVIGVVAADAGHGGGFDLDFPHRLRINKRRFECQRTVSAGRARGTAASPGNEGRMIHRVAVAALLAGLAAQALRCCSSKGARGGSIRFGSSTTAGCRRRTRPLLR
jgi:hypothetical protein